MTTIAHPFYYCSYWRTWSRILRLANHEQAQIEVNLVPTNAGHDSAWEIQVAPVILRQHRTSVMGEDLVLPKLPAAVELMIRCQLGSDAADFLLGADILEMIDFELLRKNHMPGGVPLELVRKRLVTDKPEGAILFTIGVAIVDSDQTQEYARADSYPEACEKVLAEHPGAVILDLINAELIKPSKGL